MKRCRCEHRRLCSRVGESGLYIDGGSAGQHVLRAIGAQEYGGRKGEWPFLGGDTNRGQRPAEEGGTQGRHAGRRNHLCRCMMCSVEHKMMNRNGRKS